MEATSELDPPPHWAATCYARTHLANPRMLQPARLAHGSTRAPTCGFLKNA